MDRRSFNKILMGVIGTTSIATSLLSCKKYISPNCMTGSLTGSLTGSVSGSTSGSLTGSNFGYIGSYSPNL